MSQSHGAVAAIAVLAVAVVFAVFCLVQLARAARVRYLPKWAWAPIICLMIPWGGLAFLIFGRVPPEPDIPVTAPVPAPVAAPAARPAAVPAARPPAVPAEVPGAAPGVAAGPRVPRRVPGGPVVIEVDQLTKRFGAVTALDGLSFAVRPGTVTGFLGPNGAGKTTTMRVILGLQAPTSGTALVGGRRYQGVIRPLLVVGSLLDATAV